MTTAVERRGAALFEEHIDGIHRRTDRLMAWLMGAQWLFAIAVALIVSPSSWEGKTRTVHAHVYAAVLLGGVLSSLPIALAVLRPGATVTRHVMAVAQMLWSGLLIHLTGGRIETHFHVFGSLAFLAFYRDWRVMVPATVVVASDHLIRQIVWPESVYGIADPAWWRFLEHTGWVVFEDVFLVLACVRGVSEVRDIATKRAELEAVSEREREKSAALDIALGDAISARDAAESASKIKSQFLANMSHELRTPINGVIGMTELMGRTELTSKQRHYVDTVRSSGESLLLVIGDVLDFSKIEAGKLALRDVVLRPSDVAHCVADLMAPQAQGKGVELVCDVSPEVPAAVRGDPGRLQQILGNLVANAIKFTERGEVVVRVTMPEDTGVLRFEVSDTGIGIAPDDVGRLFTAFTQVDSGDTRRYGGTGLGLAIARHLVELMKGEIGVESDVGKGSTFWFTARLDGAVDPDDEAGAPFDLSGRRILIIDDNQTNRAILEEQITSWKADVLGVSGGAQALVALRDAALAGRPFHLVVTDMQMPSMDGLAVARAVRTHDVHPPVPVVMLTSSSYPDTGAASEDVVACLTKPVRAERLRECLADALSGAARAARPDAAQAPHAHGDLPRVLLAEDNPVNREVAVEMLAELGYPVDVVENGREAVLAAGRRRYAAILMDCQMPVMNGYQAAAEIRKSEEGADRARIIAVTAYALAGDREKVLAAGMDDYLSKPLTLDLLSSALRRWTSAPLAAAEPARGSGPVLDPTVRRSKRVSELFVAQLQEWLGQLEQHVRLADHERLKEDAHRFKGSCLGVGAGEMASLCMDLEREPERARELAPAIEHNASALRRAFESEATATVAPRV